MSTLPPPSTPIAEALASLHLTADERASIGVLTHVRTLGDLAVAVERKEVEKELAAKVKKVLG